MLKVSKKLYLSLLYPFHCTFTIQESKHKQITKYMSDLKGAFVHVELPETVNGVKDVTAVNGEAISHPTAESRANGFFFGEALDSPRQGILVLCRLGTQKFKTKNGTRCSTYSLNQPVLCEDGYHT